MAHDEGLLLKLESAPASPYVGHVWRAHFSQLLPLRSNTRGARWNPPDVPALYTSLERSTARAEWQHLLDVQPALSAKPAAITEIDVNLNRVVDIRGTLTDIGIDIEALEDDMETWVGTQAVGAAVSYLGISGLLVPSLRDKDGSNLVIFTGAIDAGEEEGLEIVTSQPYDS